jgi:DNA polymerase/3'-5' exonuclease PolX
MGGTGKIPLEEAQKLAEDIRQQLLPACNRLEVAGSVRRQKPEVGDIELVAVPIDGPGELSKGQRTLFMESNAGPSPTVIQDRLRALIKEGYLTEGPRNKAGSKSPFGPRYMKTIHAASGIQLDLFVVLPPAAFGVVYLIRTGSADYSHEFVTRIQEKGYRSLDGHLEDKDGRTIPTPEEKDVYQAVGIEWIPPELRK